MKATFKMLLIVTFALLCVTAVAYAEEDADDYEPADAPKKQVVITQVFEPDFTPTEIEDEQVPLSSGTMDFSDTFSGMSGFEDLSNRNFRVQIQPNKAYPLYNEDVTLTSELYGYEGLKVGYQWQVDKGDGKGWKDVRLSTGDSHTFTYTEKRANYGWRLVVTVLGLA